MTHQRKDFEAYIDSCIESNYGFLKAVEKDESGDYPTAWVQGRWLAWQAAIAQKEAQQEPVAVPDDIVAGALYDFLGYLTTRSTRITMSDRDEAGPAVDALVDWSKTRKINLVEARVRDWNTCTSPPNTRAVLKQALEALDDTRYVSKYSHIVDAIAAIRAELGEV